MPRRKGIGKLSYRGLAALVIGVLFIWFSLNPHHFNDDVPPFLILVIMFVAGGALSFGGFISQRFVWKRGNLVRSQRPLAAEICVLEDEDHERNTETVHVRVNDQCQSLGVDRSRVARRYADGKVRWGEVWLDERGMVHAIAISGEHLNTLIGGRAIPVEYFGTKQ